MLKGMLTSEENWQSLEDIKIIFSIRKTQISEYVSDHWKEHNFYGAQFLNGVNPCSIKRCSELPSNFPVSEESVKPFREDGSTLANEMKMGNIFLYDQKILSGIPGKLYHGQELQMPAPLCLLFLNPEQKLVPIAIQVLRKATVPPLSQCSDVVRSCSRCIKNLPRGTRSPFDRYAP
nr:arachidonate 12-lipoxygenase, 12R-type-like [Syngnathus scovelli]